MYGRKTLISIGIFVILLLRVHGSQKNIEIDRNGTDDKECLQGEGKHPCQTLEYVFNQTLHNHINLNNTDVTLLNGTYNLSFIVNLEYLLNFRLVSFESAMINCTRYDDAGINFRLSKNITINGTTFQNCGAKHSPNVINSDELLGKLFTRISVHFENCTNVKIVNSRFLKNLGIAVSMVDVIGAVEVLNSNFVNNSDTSISKKMRKYISGGGIYIGLSGYNWEYNDDTYYNIFGCNFHNNSAESSYDFIFPKETLQDEETYFGKGAGLNINIHGGIYNISINNCDFSYNSALWGAAIFASFNGSSDNNILSIQNSNFSHNNATLAGGGIRVDEYVFKGYNSTYGNKILLHRLHFIENHAIWGGGLSVSLTTGINYKLKTKNRSINISSCKFSKNSATVGFAIGLDTFNRNRHSDGTAMYRAFIADSIFEENFMILTEDRMVIGQGAIYAEEVSVILMGNNHFSKNNYTALCLDSSKLTFKKLSNSTFDSNNGTEGGAISLYGFSWMLLEENCNLTFRNNKAKRRGGAIYVRNPGPPRVAFQTTKLQISSCFLRYKSDVDPDEWHVKIVFQNNSAPNASGNSIYATSLKYCRKRGEQRNESTAFKWKPISYEGNNGFYEVVTDAMYVTADLSQWNAVPGLPFDGDVKLYDEKHQNVYGTLKMEIKGAHLEPPNEVFLVRKKIQRLRLLGKVSSNYTFRFFTLSGMAIETKTYTASFQTCKPGFEQDANNTKCICMSEESSSVVRCYDNGTVYILKGKWGYLNTANDLKLDTIDCPQHYCSCHNEYEGYLCKFNEHNQCAKNRTGTLCSKCPEGKSVAFGDESCRECSDIWLLILLPLVLVLSIFSGIIFRLNIDVFSGHLNAYLYCYQMIPLMIPESITLDQFIKFIIGVTSLGGTGDNGGFCLYNGMNNLDKLFINYGIPTYVVLCTFAFGLWIPQKLWEKLFCCCRSTEDNELSAQTQARNHSFGRALSFVLVLCYSSFTTVTLKLLHPIKYNDKYVVYDAAFQQFFVGRHLIYSIIAMLVLIVVVIGFPILLLFTHHFSKHFYTVQRAEPIFNALKNNFEDTMICRYFAAFYFICRLILLIINIFIREEVLRLIILAIASVIIQAIFSAIQPYKKKAFNYWDILQLSVMCLISLLSLILSVPFTSSGRFRERLGILLQVLVYFPLLSVIVRLLLLCRCKDDDTYHDVYDVASTGGRFKRWRNQLAQRSKNTGIFPTVNVPDRVTRDIGYDVM